jgi:hypothetical protein
MKRVLRAVLVACISIGFAASAWAQLPTGAIRGRVVDPQGARIPGVTVTATQPDTGLVRSTVTNTEGEYRMGALPSGRYDVVAEISGFQRRTARIDLTLGQEAELDLSLGLAGTAEAVTVTAATPVVETTKSEVSRTIPGEVVQNLPLPGRNYLNLMLIVPGATTGGTGAAGFGVTVNGQRPRQVNFLIDGSDNNDASVNGDRTPVIQDAVGEFRIVTSNFSAEFGRNTGAVAIATTKTGTNAFHGTGFEFHENGEKFNAMSNLEQGAGFTKPGKLRRDTYGFTVGGPVMRDKMFFFGAFQGRKFEGRGASSPITSPTQAGRDALRGIAGVNPLMLELLNKYIPLPNGTTLRSLTVAGQSIPVADYTATLPNARDNRQTIIRIDRTLSSSDTMFGRYIYAKTETIGASNPPGFANDSVFPTHNFVTTWNRVISPALLNEFHFSYGRSGGLFPGGSTNPSGNNDLPTFGVTGLWSIGLAVNIPQDRKEQVWQFTDAVSYLRGNHAIKIGTDLRKIKLTSFVPFDFRTTYTYTNLQTFLFNQPQTTLRAFGDPGPEFNFWETGSFIQDDWKVSQDLTLNLGLRYELVQAAQGFYSNVATDKNNIGPRVGFAWDMSKKGTTVLRGGYAKAYDQFFLNIPLLTFQSPPYQRRISDNSGAFPYPLAPADRSITPAEVKTLNLLDIPDEAQIPQGHQWTVGLQRQLGSVWRAEVAYVGSLGRDLIRQRVQNPVLCCPRQTVIGPTGLTALRRVGDDPLQTGQISVLESAGKSEYHSGQFSVERRLSDGFSFTAAYTWSRFLDDASESLGTGTPSLQRPQNNFDFASEWSRSSWDRPHRLIVTWVWEVPYKRDQQGVLGRTLGGWNIAGDYTAQSGQPFTIQNGVDSNGDGDAGNDRPNLGTGDRTTTAGYVQNAALSGLLGNLPRNSERGPGVNRWNTVFFKNVRLAGNHQIQIRGEIFNLFNTRQYVLTTNGVERNLANPTRFYDFTTTAGGNREADGPVWGVRSVILGVKYLF